jgi:effector-binding domain-containing protein
MLENSQKEPHPIFLAIESGNLKEVNKIINKDPSVLEQEDSKMRTPIFHAIRSGNLKIVKAIIKKAPSVLKWEDSDWNTPIVYAIRWGKLKIVEAIFEEDRSVLEQKDPDGMTPIFHAILFKNPEIVKAIIKKDLSVLGVKDSNAITPISLAAGMSIRFSSRDKDDKASKVLQTILKCRFPGHINKAIQEDFKELFSKTMLVKGIYSGEDAGFGFDGLEKAFDKITPENTFKKIYQELFEKVNKNQSISSKNNEEMFIFQSKLKSHESFFIFHVNKEDGKLTSISYCDGHTIDEGRKIKDSATHINGVTTFKLKTPIEYSYENFVKDFINENTQNISVVVFHNKFREKKLYFKGSHIEFSEITHSIPTRVQRRGNCVFKSSSVLARKISEQQNPATMAYCFNSETKTPYGSGYDEHKKFKTKLAENALVSIIETKEKISLKSDPIRNYLIEKIEDTIKIAGVYNKRKLMPIPEEKYNEFKRAKRRKITTVVHEEIKAILSNESPKKSLSPRTNKTSPLSTKITDPQITRP